MAYWKLEIIGKDEVTDYDKEHISELISQGYTEGDLSSDEPGYEEGED